MSQNNVKNVEKLLLFDQKLRELRHLTQELDMSIIISARGSILLSGKVPDLLTDFTVLVRELIEVKLFKDEAEFREYVDYMFLLIKKYDESKDAKQ